MLKHLKIILIFPLLIASCSEHKPGKNNADTSVSLIEKIFESDEISIIGVGDIMMGTTYPSSALPPDDGKDLFAGVSDILTEADITFGNLEGPFLNSGGTPKKCLSEDNCYSFRMPVRYARYLDDAGFDLLNLANNHSGDMGKEGRESTMKTLDELNLAYVGLSDYPSEILNYKGKKFGFAGFSPNRGTPGLNDIEEAVKIVRKLKDECDIVIVTFHGGAEGAGAQRVPKRKEYFLGENRGDVYEFAHAVIDAGADLVMGHGPHVTRAVELYNKRFIAYSMGNFCTYGKFSLSGPQGIAPIIKVFMNKNGEFIRAEVTSVKQIKRGFPVTDESNAAYLKIKYLTEIDFPETNLIFGDDNIISPAD
ncbi:MAG: CapA family protein [Ignavibacteria bacterium]|jgi:poly-gamma-glutamate capsule biosynthesis protein CapA/YwtB (metallophosphatase superfamily)|nr:CapA family protein [Ignavibacteria bacterium]